MAGEHPRKTGENYLKKKNSNIGLAKFKMMFSQSRSNFQLWLNHRTFIVSIPAYKNN
jgi:hypothetical protein